MHQFGVYGGEGRAAAIFAGGTDTKIIRMDHKRVVNTHNLVNQLVFAALKPRLSIRWHFFVASRLHATVRFNTSACIYNQTRAQNPRKSVFRSVDSYPYDM